MSDDKPYSFLTDELLVEDARQLMQETFDRAFEANRAGATEPEFCAAEETEAGVSQLSVRVKLRELRELGTFEIEYPPDIPPRGSPRHWVFERKSDNGIIVLSDAKRAVLQRLGSVHIDVFVHDGEQEN